MTRRPRPAGLARVRLLLCAVGAALLLATAPRGGQAQQAPDEQDFQVLAQSAVPAAFAGDVIPTKYICPFVTALNKKSNSDACDLANSLVNGLVALTPDPCPEPRDTGHGRQVQPPAAGADGSAAPKPLTKVAGGVPVRFNPDGASPAQLAAYQRVLVAEAPTYNWLWQVIRNIKLFWPCSRAFGGRSAGYLVPSGWEAVGADGGSPDLPLGVYAVAEEDGRAYPTMVILWQPSTGHLVVAVRGSATAAEWRRNFMYHRTAGHAFALGSGSGAATSTFPGETHAGFTLGFDALWPSVRSALEQAAFLAGGNATSRARAGRPAMTVTFAGHSMGAAVASLLSYAASTYLSSIKSKAIVSLVTFGSPNVGNSAFVSGLNAAVNIRRIAFENDPVTMVPCATAADAKEASMPACPGGAVPTPAPDGRTYWSDYQATKGEILLKAASMPAQVGEAWNFTNHFGINPSTQMIAAVHSCPYACALRSLSGGDTRGDNCLMKRVPEGSPLLASHGYCIGFPDDASTWPREELDTQPLTDLSVFPSQGARPRMWDFRTYASASSWSCGWDANGVLMLDVKHTPLPGVTPAMMRWLFNNLQGSSVHGGVSYPNFLLLHPRDHVCYTASHTPLDDRAFAPEVTAKFAEFQATGCRETGDPSSPYTCPSGPATPNPGVTASTPSAEWLGLSLDPLNATYVVQAFSAAGISLAERRCSGSRCAWTVQIDHSWRAVNGQLQVTTHQVVGLDMGFGIVRNRVNPAIVGAWRNGVVSAEKKCQRLALHYIEEFGALQHWLPAAYQQRSSRRRRR